ncbi:MAG: 23S rRNA (uracil(1939)-C(5))-methyltransferase RlmD [Clostridia bacterium]|nr:23S rRNA (uracil(1939)-C(5))-methyltransferase RlmD [Clostridia bacterium]
MKILIEELNINGEGLSYIDGKKYCVKGVLTGENVDVLEKSEKRNFVDTKLNKIVHPSPIRILSKCVWCDKCGGCDFMFADEKNALKVKKNIIKNYFLDFFSKEIITHSSKNNIHYRNKVSFAVNGDKIGLQKKNSNEIVEVDECLVAKNEINMVLKIFREYLGKTQNSTINHLVIRAVDNYVSVVLVCKITPKNLDFCAKKLECAFGNRFGLFLNFNTSKNKILGDKWQYVCGQKEICSKALGINFFVKPHSFLQINDDVRDKLYNRILREIDGGVVIEGYSGAGLLSAVMAKKAEKVFAVEINKTASLDAEKTKIENSLFNLENINGDCGLLLPKLVKKFPNATFVVDPPRSGLDKNIINAIINSDVKKVVYISCNPYTLKQNIYLLKDKFEVVNFEIFDIFPQTFEIESFVVLNRK